MICHLSFPTSTHLVPSTSIVHYDTEMYFMAVWSQLIISTGRISSKLTTCLMFKRNCSLKLSKSSFFSPFPCSSISYGPRIWSIWCSHHFHLTNWNLCFTQCRWAVVITIAVFTGVPPHKYLTYSWTCLSSSSPRNNCLSNLLYDSSSTSILFSVLKEDWLHSSIV